MVLLPGGRPESVSLLGYGGYVNHVWSKPRAKHLANRLKFWNEKYEAEPFACSEGVLSFFVKRPPQSLDEARSVMAEIYKLGGYPRDEGLLVESYGLVNRRFWKVLYCAHNDI